MIDVFDPRYENPDQCEIVHKCREKKCKDDIYILPGWDGSVPIVQGDLGMRFDSYLEEYFNSHDVYSCRNLPYYESDHDIEKVSNAVVQQIEKHSPGKKVAIIGNCFGGWGAMNVAENHPDKLSSMVTAFSFDSVPLYQKIGRDLGLNDDLMDYFTGWFMGSRTGKYLLDIFSDNEDKETVKGLMHYWKYDDEDGVKNIKVPTYVFNCSTDIVLGRFPEIKGAKKDVDPFCFHHRIRPDNVKDMADFINNR